MRRTRHNAASARKFPPLAGSSTPGRCHRAAHGRRQARGCDRSPSRRGSVEACRSILIAGGDFFMRFLIAALLLAATVAAAQDYPNKPIRVIVPYAAGGLPDTITRLIQ